MAMSQTTLANAFVNLVPAATELAAVNAFATAYATFAGEATAGAVNITPAGVALGRAAMASALVGLSMPNAGIAIIQNAVVAFWSAVALGLATSFPAAIVVTPPPHAGLLVALTTVFSNNIASSANQTTACNALASALYAQAIIGGTVTFPPSVVQPIL